MRLTARQRGRIYCVQMDEKIELDFRTEATHDQFSRLRMLCTRYSGTLEIGTLASLPPNLIIREILMFSESKIPKLHIEEAVVQICHCQYLFPLF